MNNSIKRKLFLIAIAFHFTVIGAVCVHSSLDSYTSFYDIEPKGLTKHIMDVSYMMAVSNGVQHYSAVGGIDAGYGFFAPNVASEYILEFTLYDKNDNVVSKQSMPTFKHKESYDRYSTLLGSFQDKLIAKTESQDSTTLRQRHLDVVIKSMAKGLLDEERISKVSATLYLYHFPSLAEYAQGDIEALMIPFERTVVAL